MCIYTYTPHETPYSSPLLLLQSFLLQSIPTTSDESQLEGLPKVFRVLEPNPAEVVFTGNQKVQAVVSGWKREANY